MTETNWQGAGHRGWHYRGYHPHMDAPEAVQTISFRLADSVPKALLARWQVQLRLSRPDTNATARQLVRLVAEYEDRGYGACYLRDPAVAAVVQDALHFRDGQSYRLFEWCVMPNHVHVLIQQYHGVALSRVVASWKSYTAQRANHLLGRRGRFWMADYFDRYIRTAEHFEQASLYIRNNPVAAGLCRRPEDWRWSSANWGARRGETPE